MTSAEPPNGRSKLRAAGYGFLGIGAVAAVLGASTLAAAGPSEDEAASAPESPSVTEPGGELGQHPSDGTGNGSAGDATDTTEPGSQDQSTGDSDADSAEGSTEGSGDSSTGQPPAGEGDSAGDGNTAGSNTATPEEQASDVPVRILNNSKIQGLADQAGSDLRHAGYDVTEVGNYARGIVPNTTAYFRPGTPEQKQAKRIARQFDARAKPRGEGLVGADPGVIVVVTKDYDD